MPANIGNTGKKVMAGIDTTIVRPKVKPPAEMTKEGKKQWRKLVNSTPNEQFTVSDYPILAAYCEAYALMVKANKMLEAEGEVLLDESSGRSYANPWTTILSQSQSKINAMVTKLRLSPGSRREAHQTKEKAPPSTSGSKLSKMLGK